MPDTRVLLFGAGAGVVLVVAAALIGRRAIDAAGQAVQALNPLNPRNVIAEGVNEVGRTVSGDAHWSLGAWVWEFTHPAQREAERRAVGGGATGQW